MSYLIFLNIKFNMNKIWSIVIIISIIFASNKTNDIIFESLDRARDYVLSIMFLMAFWSGINNIILHTSLKESLSKIFKPFYKFLYGNEIDKKTIELMSINTFGNLLGIGNSSIISGLEVCKRLKGKNLIVFVSLNTASIQLIPTTIINIRRLMGAEKDIIGNVWFISFISLVFLVVILKLYMRFAND